MRRRISFLALILSLVLIAVTVALAYRGYSFYKLSLDDRVEHPDFRTLRPSGLVGNGYGWVAALLVVLNLSYLIRRRFGAANLGSIAWFPARPARAITACNSARRIANSRRCPGAWR